MNQEALAAKAPSTQPTDHLDTRHRHLSLPPLGAFPRADGISFRLFTTTASRCQVRLFDSDRQTVATHPLTAIGGGYFEADLQAPNARSYMFVLDGKELPDPYARFLPFGVHGPASLVGPHHRWQHANVSRPLCEHVIYEMHVGTFTDAGTYRAATERLRDLASLGVTAIELMPVSSFAGSRGWGYDGVAHFAPFAPYGSPDDLRFLVDEAHGLGLAMFLDVVYNHFGPAGNYLPAYSPRYFSETVKNAWGNAPDFENPLMRQYVLDNARYWLTEFRFDGLRLDATHTIADPSPTHILRELATEVSQLDPPRLLIAEDERNDPELVAAHGLHAIWADDFHHQVRVTLTGEREGYFAGYRPGANDLAETIQGGWLYRGQIYPPTSDPRGHDASHLPAEAFVYCIQNHDQVGNRALGDRLSHSVSIDAYCSVSALLLLLPTTPLLFMGQEWAASSPFLFFTDHEEELGRRIVDGRRKEFRHFRAFADPGGTARIPDPQATETFMRSRLRWHERSEGDHHRVLTLYRKLLAVRRTDPVLRAASRDALEVSARDSVLSVRRWSAAGDRLLLVNMGSSGVALDHFGAVAGRPVLLRTDDRLPPPGTLPGHTAVLLGSRG
jgi:maltooligosyltrehalose trehalohydrolase